jgi:predicted metal-binding membrane protein
MAAASNHPITVRRLSPRLDRGSILTGAALLAVAGAAWAALLLPPAEVEVTMSGMGTATGTAVGDSSTVQELLAQATAAGAFVASWMVMMTAMMLPSALPMFVSHRAVSSGTAGLKAAHSGLLVGGYLLGWALFGAGVYLLQQLAAAVAESQPAVRDAWAYMVATVLVVAGLYQFSRLKEVCLRQCRSPLSFLFTHWQPGASGSLRLGLHHGLYCVGCCWGLMTVLVTAGAMGTAWVALIALVVFVEKVLPYGTAVARLGGAVLIAAGIGVMLRPEFATHVRM